MTHEQIEALAQKTALKLHWQHEHDRRIIAEVILEAFDMAKRGAGDDGLEIAAKWHEAQALELENWRERYGTEIFPTAWSRYHRADANSIRALSAPPAK